MGCGFGGLAVALSTLAPTKLTLAFEIRPKVAEFVRRRIESLRRQHPGSYENVACLRYNAMLHLPNLLPKSSLEKIFFCFPDPHFKAKNHRRRIVSEPLLAEYAYVLKEGGLLYAITDVEELHTWHVAKLDAHNCFEKVDLSDDDAYVNAITQETEEGKKVTRQGGHMKDGSKYAAVYRVVRAAGRGRRPSAGARQRVCRGVLPGEFSSPSKKDRALDDSGVGAAAAAAAVGVAGAS